MLELTSARKSKVNLADYNYQQDMENRMLLADSSPFDLSVLEEILFSPLKISLKKLVRNIGGEESEVLSVLYKLSKTGLLSIQEDTILIDKENRKYFESQICRFSPDFKPDMEFLQNILRKAPIHVLPAWFSIPRTSNNIFDSIVEKHLLTPQIYQRYLQDLHFPDPIIPSIITDLFSAPDFQIQSSDLIAKYNLDRHRFEEITLILEFHAIGCLSYRKEEGHWTELLTPFHEWHQYLRFLKETEPPVLPSSSVTRIAESDFAFVEIMAAILNCLSKKPLPSTAWDGESLLPEEIAKMLSCAIASKEPLLNDHSYLTQALRKLFLVQLAENSQGEIIPSEITKEWLKKKKEDQALYLYQHPANRILNPDIPANLNTERHIRETEKSIRRILHGKWVLFEDFFKSVMVPLSEESVISLKRVGKHYKYVLPSYSQEENHLIKATLFEWLFEAGMVAIGHSNGKDCFSVTRFGQLCFEN